MELSSIIVALMGLSTLFLGLICVALWRIAGSREAAAEPGMGAPAMPAQYSAPAQPASAAPSPEFIAAVSAAIAEELGTDITGIRITSIKKL